MAIIIPAPVLFLWVWLDFHGSFVGEEGLGLLVFLLFGGCELFLLGTRWFAPVFGECHVLWRIPVLALGAGTAWCLGFVILMTAIIGK